METDIETDAWPMAAAGRARGGRASQQDEVLCLHDADSDTRLLVLADGMGGDGAGERAAAGVIDTARAMWARGAWRHQPGALFLEQFCQAAHDALRVLASDPSVEGEPHSTVVALLVRGLRASWVHVGDSRLYHFRGTRCLHRTEDHSLAQLKVKRGELDADKIASDPDQHRLLRGLGGEHAPEVEHGGAMLGPGQGLVLCSDGIWASLSTSELADFSRRGEPRTAVREALDLAVRRGGSSGDNAALIVLRTGRLAWWLSWLRRRRALPGQPGAGAADDVVV